jgi:hypothetical protein
MHFPFPFSSSGPGYVHAKYSLMVNLLLFSTLFTVARNSYQIKAF